MKQEGQPRWPRCKSTPSTLSTHIMANVVTRLKWKKAIQSKVFSKTWQPAYAPKVVRKERVCKESKERLTSYKKTKHTTRNMTLAPGYNRRPTQSSARCSLCQVSHLILLRASGSLASIELAATLTLLLILGFFIWTDGRFVIGVDVTSSLLELHARAGPIAHPRCALLSDAFSSMDDRKKLKVKLARSAKFYYIYIFIYLVLGWRFGWVPLNGGGFIIINNTHISSWCASNAGNAMYIQALFLYIMIVCFYFILYLSILFFFLGGVVL